MKIVHIHKDDTMDEINIDVIDRLVDYSKSQGEGDIQCLYMWKYECNRIYCYGWYDGELGFETKHELPPGGMSKFLTDDSSCQTLYGDMFIVKMSSDETLIDFDISEYGEFYHVSSGGCSDISECEEEEVDEETSAEESEYDDDEEEELIFEPSPSPYTGELEEDTYEYEI